MKKLKIPIVLLLFVMVAFSCANEFENDVQSVETDQLRSTDLSVKSVSQINDPLLSKNLPVSVNNAKGVLSKGLGQYFHDHDLNNLSLDQDNVLESNHSDGIRSYTFYLNIPQKEIGKGKNFDTYLTLSFDAQKNMSSYVQLGADQILYFDEKGDILEKEKPNETRYGYYSPKPSNKPSKAPKSVVCNWASSTGNLGLLNGYCGYTIGIGGPPPIEVLASLFPEWYVYVNGQWIELSTPMAIIPLTTSYNELYYLYSNGSLYPLYNLNFHPNFSQLYTEIVNYYDMVYVNELGYAINNPYTLTYEEDHVHKQAFIDSFFQWTYLMESNYPSHYSYLVNNPSVYYQIFNFFAEYNTNNPVNEYTYLGQPWYVVQYTPNQDVKCINNGSDYLLTSAGLTLMQQLGSGAITIEQFRSALPNCN